MSELYRDEELDIITFKLMLELNNNWEEQKKNVTFKYERDGIIYNYTCLNDCKGNVHTSLRALSERIPYEYRKQVYCIHIDGENFIEKANAEGFNVVKII